MNNLSVLKAMRLSIKLTCCVFFALQLSAQNKVEIIGQIKITGGSPAVGKVLTSDSEGLGTWQYPVGETKHYASIYNLSAQIVAIESDVIFDNNAILTSAFTHLPSTSQISFLESGTYKVNFSVSGTEPNQFALFLNGAQVAGSVYASGAGTQQNNGVALLVASVGDILTLRNHSSAAAVTLASYIGGTEENVNASIVIEKL